MCAWTTDSLIDECRKSGLRTTKLLHAILELLCKDDAPLSVQICPKLSPDLATADTVTLYRLFERLESAGIVRRIGLHERSAHFVLADSLRHRHFVCCTDCGQVQPLQHRCTLAKLNEEVSQETGFRDLYHQLVFYGHCPKCANS